MTARFTDAELAGLERAHKSLTQGVPLDSDDDYVDAGDPRICVLVNAAPRLIAAARLANEQADTIERLKRIVVGVQQTPRCTAPRAVPDG